MEIIVFLAIVGMVVWIASSSSADRIKHVAWHSNSPLKESQRVRVKWIIDGDTVIVSKSWREMRIRLDAIDCPEDGQPWGDIAKAGLIKLIGGREVLLEEHGVDRHNRTLATIYVRSKSKPEWINVNEKMVMLGHAWVSWKYYDHLLPPRQRKLDQLQRWARSKRVGLWGTDNPIPPWQWRKQV